MKLESLLQRIGDFGIAAILFAGAFGYVLVRGKDLNWDQFNYHFYLGFSFVENRLGIDFMPANGQSYLNPLPYVPFYWMVSAGWHSVLIAFTLTLFHTINLVAVYLIARRVVEDESNSRLFAFCSALLAGLNPVYLGELGTSFADISTSAIALLGLLALLPRSDRACSSVKQVLVGGLCIGLASGLKLTNAIFGIAAAVSLAFAGGVVRNRARNVLLLALGGLAGAAAAHGYWSYLLWREFGNPFFPLFNAIFQSPDFPTISQHHQRYLPTSWWDWLALPFRMTQLRSWIYTETVAPDLRFAALALLVCGVLLEWKRIKPVWQRIRVGAKSVFIFLAIAYWLWGASSGNGRYGIVVTLLCGLIVVMIARFWFYDRFPRSTLAALFGLITLQLLHLTNADLNWGSASWTSSWYQASVPERLLREPNLFVSVGPNSNSYVAPFLSRASAFINPIGQMSFDLEGPGGERFKSLQRSFGSRVRIVNMLPTSYREGDRPESNWFRSANSLLARLGYVVDESDCVPIKTSGTTVEIGQDFDMPDTQWRWLITCHLEPIRIRGVETRNEVKKLFARVVEWCPRLFRPNYIVVDQIPNGWFSTFPDTDSLLRIDGGEMSILVSHTSVSLPLGKPSDWSPDRALPLKCENMPQIPQRFRRENRFD